MCDLIFRCRIEQGGRVIDRRVDETVIGLRIAAGGHEPGVGFDRGFDLLRHLSGEPCSELRNTAAQTYTSAYAASVNPLTRQADRSEMRALKGLPGEEPAINRYLH